MYVTRRLSQLLQSPDTLSAPPDGPNSGYLVIKGEESDTYNSGCFGFCKYKDNSLTKLPFPQNKELSLSIYLNNGDYRYPVYLVPVLNQPLSSSRYYVIVSDRKPVYLKLEDRKPPEYPYANCQGEAFTCSSELHKHTSCFSHFTSIVDYKPRPLDPANIYQQFKIQNSGTNRLFYAKSIATDAYPPYFLRVAWSTTGYTPPNFKLDTAQGLDPKLRALLPDFDFSISQKCSKSLEVGKWYCPFMFVKEGTVTYQVTNSMYYQMTLEQRWEQIFSCANTKGIDSVMIDALVDKEKVFVGGREAIWDERIVAGGVIWFASCDGRKSVGLRREIVERMKWEQERGGWKKGEEKKVVINKVEEFEGDGKWNEFGCYVLVERFNLKRMDGSLVMSYDFMHIDKIKNKWE